MMIQSPRLNVPQPRTKGFAFFLHLMDAVRLAVQGWRERAKLQREFDELRGRGELDRTLTDSGISASDLPRLMRLHPGTPQQLAAMMRRLGLERHGLAPRWAMTETLRAIEWRCGECMDWCKCRDWLAMSEPAETYRAFCPNAEALDRIRCVGAVTAGAASGVLAELAAERPAPEGR